MTLKDVEKVINLAFGSFWEKNLEPALNEFHEEINGVKERLGRVEGKVDDLDKKVTGLDTKVDSLDSKVDDLSLEVKSHGRKLDSEIAYRDRLEKRVKVLERSH